jgi:hypothetical protein
VAAVGTAIASTRYQDKIKAEQMVNTPPGQVPQRNSLTTFQKVTRVTVAILGLGAMLAFSDALAGGKVTKQIFRN